MTDSQAVPCHNPQVVCRRLADGEAVLLRLDTGMYHGLNRTGAAVWDLVDGERNAGEIARALEPLLEEPSELLERVVDSFLTSLGERALVAFAPRS